MISRILVANRGEIARRIFRTCREMGIATVAVYSDPDSGEPHMREADVAVHLPGSTSSKTYLNIHAVVTAALEAHADAVHPGYGFLAENARFARAVQEAGLTWIGPPAEAIELMGSKLQSKTLMKSVGIPILQSVELGADTDVMAAASGIGYPILVKASAGGGGKGMRVVHDPNHLVEAIAGARREAEAAFDDGTVFLERYLQAPRHIEIQVFADSHGQAMSLHERECSIQRRHQKIIEEAPSPVIDQATRAAMGAAAVTAAEAVRYVGAGTVEFLYQEGSFYFLEMNTRLQVEHPVTEMVTGLDLVKMQIEVADGGPLPASAPQINGHAIEARLYAEDPMRDFLPVTGEIHRFEFPDLPGLRVDSGVDDGSKISVHYDPMIAKVVFHAATRRAAAVGLASALRGARLHTSTTNRSLLVRVLESAEFLAADTDTHFLQRHDPADLGVPLADPEQERLAAIGAALADQAEAREGAKVLRSVPSGWRNSMSRMQVREYRGHHDTYEVLYSMDPRGFTDEALGHIDVLNLAPSTAQISTGETVHRLEVARYGRRRFVDSEDAPVYLEEVARFPLSDVDADAGSLHAPMPGRVIRLEVSEGDHVEEGQVLVVMEAMKMEHTLRAPHPGSVTRVLHAEGDQVEGGAILVVVEAEH